MATTEVGRDWKEVSYKRKVYSSTVPIPPPVQKPSLIKLYMEDVEDTIDYWKFAVYSYIIGVNPPWETMAGFFKRVWKIYDIDKISFLPNGVFVVRFKSLEHQ